ncbi:MAG TPA: hypothetical protein VMR92_00535 [Gemmatimonadales bacterium]|nr:hypothetical protein [Gemmatimonadales bacterium]
MRTQLLVLTALVAFAGSTAAQRRARIGPTVSSISIEDGSGGSHAFPSYGASLAFLSGEDGEVGIGVSRYNNLSTDNCLREMTFYGLESSYYPVGAKDIAPFASTAVGLARVLDQNPTLALLGCDTGAETTSELGLGFGLGVRLNLGAQVAALLEGRFFQVPNSAIQSLEGRANVSFAFGSLRQRSELLSGTLGPAVGIITHLSGPIEGRAPTVGVRFRRDTKKSGSLGLQIDYAPLRVTTGCSANCEPYAVLFAPAYEPALRTSWGRIYAGVGFLLAGFPSVGDDRGMAQGAHGGLGADILSGGSLMLNVNARALWLQRNDPDNRNAFLLQIGASLSPAIESR